MTTSTRLITILTVAVGVVMAAAGYLIVKAQEEMLLGQMRTELRAHAVTLQIALDTSLGAGRSGETKQLIDRINENPKLFGVVLFDEGANVSMLSSPLVVDDVGSIAEARRVIANGEAVETERVVDGRRVFSITMPLAIGGGRRGAFEIAEWMSFVEEDIARSRLAIALTTLLLWLTISVVVVGVMRRNLGAPIRELLAGADAVGRGRLDHRVVVPESSAEFARLAEAFNRMAEGLVAQRAGAERDVEARVALERELRHSERLALVGQLAAGVAHELGAPLNVIDARAEQLLDRPDMALASRQRNLTIIRAQATRITRIVRQLLDLARPHEMRRERVEVGALIEASLDLVQAEAAMAGVDVRVARAEPVWVEGDGDRLSQIFLNVCLNAVQAMAGGGALSIEVSEAGGRAVVRVADTGGGIAPEHLPHVFEPFFTTKAVGEGTGLGLAVSRRIVEEHGGRIAVENNSGGGATFTIELPAQADGESAAGAGAGKGAHDATAVADR
jgi:two-component system NtrC family sensor kinase